MATLEAVSGTRDEPELVVPSAALHTAVHERERRLAHVLDLHLQRDCPARQVTRPLGEQPYDEPMAGVFTQSQPYTQRLRDPPGDGAVRHVR